eukprot:1995309-Rhodomonas_salina.1
MAASASFLPGPARCQRRPRAHAVRTTQGLIASSPEINPSCSLQRPQGRASTFVRVNVCVRLGGEVGGGGGTYRRARLRSRAARWSAATPHA